MPDQASALSRGAEELLAALEQRVFGSPAPVSEWLRALLLQDRGLAATVFPGRDLDTLAALSPEESGPALTRAELVEAASRRAASLGGPLVRAADVAGALVDLVDEARARASAPVEQPAAPATSTTGSLAPSTSGRARTFRVFVSSTFEDFDVERDVLRREVWPALRELCAEHGARFQAIDLRWGVSEEAAVDQQTMNVCLGEIERCQRVTPRPDFLVLLGNRAGWQPPPPQVPATEYARIRDWLAAQPTSSLPWRGDEDPVPRADDLAPVDLLDRWYERDDNARLGDHDPFESEYRLRARTGSYRDAGRWAAVERRLVRVLAAAVENLADWPEATRGCYLSSATAQEIAAGALEAADPDQAVCFIREIEVPAGGAGAGARPDRYVDDDQTRLEELKGRIRARLGEHRVITAGRPLRWVGDAPERGDDYLAAFADGVREALARSITDELEHPLAGSDVGAPAGADELEREVGLHLRFAEEGARHFTGREDELAGIRDYLDGAAPLPLVVHGIGGTGKSALLAEAVERVRRGTPGATVVARFIGATPGSSDGRSLLSSVCHQLARAGGGAETPVPASYPELVVDFAERLGQVAQRGPVWVFVDSLDQLAGGAGGDARSLTWVPSVLPEGVRMVLSTRPGDTLERLRGRAELTELGGLPDNDGATLLALWLASRHRTLQPSQRRAVLDAFADSAGNPLHLRLAFEEARRWSSGDGEPPETLAVGVRELIRENMLARLASEDNHGAPLVASALGYLAASRHGLTEDELTDLLSRDPDVYRWFLLGAFHLPEDLVDAARAYAGRPHDLDPVRWLTRCRDAARILEEEPWQVHRVLDPDTGRTVSELAALVGLPEGRVQRVVTRMAAGHLAAVDDEGRWTAARAVARSADPRTAWAAAYLAVNEVDGYDGTGSDRWLQQLQVWRDELDDFLAGVVPARVPAPGAGRADGSPRLVARPRPGVELPVVLWSRLSFDLAPYLTERRTADGDLLAFYHRELQDVAAEVYAAGATGTVLHGRLADYFRAEADPEGDRSWVIGEGKRAGARGLAELPHHLAWAGRWADLHATLTDFRFLEQKAAHVGVTLRAEGGRAVPFHAGVLQLQDDIGEALRLMPGGNEEEDSGDARLVVTAVDLGGGPAVVCPRCHVAHLFGRECPACRTEHVLADWTGQDVTCPTGSCHGPLRVNAFVVGPQAPA